jgi:hypothetical protein
MKKQLLLASFLLLALTIGSSFNSKNTTSKFANFCLDWTGATFTRGDASTPLNILTNWTKDVNCGTTCPNPFKKLCKSEITLVSGTMPSDQAIIDGIKTQYDALVAAGTLNTIWIDGYTFTITIGGNVISVTIRLKS